MAGAMSGAHRRTVGGLDAILVDPGSLVAEVPPPVDVLAGFDAIVQCSGALLQTTLAQSLSRKGLAALSARTPWDPSVVSPGLRAAVLARFGHSLALRSSFLEVRLVTPILVSLRWPDLPGAPVGGSTASVRRAERRGRPAAASALVRSAEIAWQLEVNILPRALTPGESGPAAVGDSAPGRTLIGGGTARTGARPELEVSSSRLRFGMELEFFDKPPTTSTDDPAVSEFLATTLGKGLVAQAAAPLASTSGTRLTPTVGPGGPLTPTQVQSMNLAPLQIRDVLLTDTAGGYVLALCAELGGTQGVLSRVRPFLGRQDFGYAASIRLLGPVLKMRWSLKAVGLSFSGDIPVELPVSEDSDETATGRARLHVAISNTLDDVALRGAGGETGDVLRLLSRQTITLLELWNHEGRRFEDLGPLAAPHTGALAWALGFSGAVADQPSLHPDLREFLLKLLVILTFPVFESFRIKDLASVASSATRSLLTRWALRSPLDDVVAPRPEVAAEL